MKIYFTLLPDGAVQFLPEDMALSKEEAHRLGDFILALKCRLAQMPLPDDKILNELSSIPGRDMEKINEIKV